MLFVFRKYLKKKLFFNLKIIFKYIQVKEGIPNTNPLNFKDESEQSRMPGTGSQLIFWSCLSDFTKLSFQYLKIKHNR